MNYYGIHVEISLRGAPLNTAKNEVRAFPLLEGAFWGNWFKGSSLFACYDAANVRNSRAHKRECAAGHLSKDRSVVGCGPLVIAGSCANLCQPAKLASGASFRSCSAKDLVSKRVLTTYLPK